MSSTGRLVSVSFTPMANPLKLGLGPFLLVLEKTRSQFLKMVRWVLEL